MHSLFIDNQANTSFIASVDSTSSDTTITHSKRNCNSITDNYQYKNILVFNEGSYIKPVRTPIYFCLMRHPPTHPRTPPRTHTPHTPPYTHRLPSRPNIIIGQYFCSNRILPRQIINIAPAVTNIDWKMRKFIRLLQR